jgi:hypothetical protein
MPSDLAEVIGDMDARKALALDDLAHLRPVVSIFRDGALVASSLIPPSTDPMSTAQAVGDAALLMYPMDADAVVVTMNGMRSTTPGAIPTEDPASHPVSMYLAIDRAGRRLCMVRQQSIGDHGEVEHRGELMTAQVTTGLVWESLGFTVEMPERWSAMIERLGSIEPRHVAAWLAESGHTVFI